MLVSTLSLTGLLGGGARVPPSRSSTPMATGFPGASPRSCPCRSTAYSRAWSSAGRTFQSRAAVGSRRTRDARLPLTQDHPTGLEDLFTVVWWDQRGAGLSYHPDIPPESMSIEQLVDDTVAVTDFLRERFRQDRIYLLGHSWGSFVAVQAAARAPDRYGAYLGMAQVVHQLESEQIAYDYLLAAYRERGDTGWCAGWGRRPSRSEAEHPTRT